MGKAATCGSPSPTTARLPSSPTGTTARPGRRPSRCTPRARERPPPGWRPARRHSPPIGPRASTARCRSPVRARASSSTVRPGPFRIPRTTPPRTSASRSTSGTGRTLCCSPCSWCRWRTSWSAATRRCSTSGAAAWCSSPPPQCPTSPLPTTATVRLRWAGAASPTASWCRGMPATWTSTPSTWRTARGGRWPKGCGDRGPSLPAAATSPGGTASGASGSPSIPAAGRRST